MCVHTCMCAAARASAWEQLFRTVLATHTWVWLALSDSLPLALPTHPPPFFSGGRGMLAAPIILMRSLSLPGGQACVRSCTTHKHTLAHTECCQEREHEALMLWSTLFRFPRPPLSLSLCLPLTFFSPSSLPSSLLLHHRCSTLTSIELTCGALHVLSCTLTLQ